MHDDETFKEILKLEESLWIAETRYDSSAMDAIFADDFFEFGRSGRRWNRDDLLDVSGDYIPVTLPFPNFEARYLAADVIQTTYISELTENGVVLRALRSSIWSKESDGWKIRFHQGTPTK